MNTTSRFESEQFARFDEETAIITGSTRGIGASIAHRFATEGSNVVVSGRTESAGKAVAREINTMDGTGEALFVRADMANPEDIRTLVSQAVDEFGQINTIVNNAAVQTESSVETTTLEQWELLVSVNFRGYWLLVKQALEHMPEGSSIVNISSNHSQLTMPNTFPYNAIKSGVDGMTRAMAVELGPIGIRANSVNPGWVEVERTRKELVDGRYEEIESMHPLGRIGAPADIAGVVTFLASDDAAFVTGSSLLADGGRSAIMEDGSFISYANSKRDM